MGEGPKKTVRIAADDADEDLQRSLLTTWNAKVVDYDNDRFPFNEWVLKRIQSSGYPLEDLTQLHKVVPGPEQYKLCKSLCADTELPEFKRMLNTFVREVVAVKGNLRHPIAVQRFPNVRFLLPNQPESIFPYHTGLLYGHGIASRSLWMPLTDVTADEDASASMLIIDTETSRRLVKYAVDNRLRCTQMTELFGKYSWALKCGPGKLCFFTQENIHGNVPNVTGKTRVSIDFRVAEAQHGDLLARKIPAGYFHIIPETEEEELRSGLADGGVGKRSIDNGKKNTFYINNNTPSTFGVPVHLQRYMLYDYSAKNNLNYGYELFELEDMAHLPTLQHIVGESKTNVIMYSIFALPEDAEDRNTLLDTAIENGLTIFFVNEDLILQSRDDLRVINRYLDFAKYGRSRMPIGLPLSNRSKSMFKNWTSA